jgi:hypothetical protein
VTRCELDGWFEGAMGVSTDEGELGSLKAGVAWRSCSSISSCRSWRPAKLRRVKLLGLLRTSSLNLELNDDEPVHFCLWEISQRRSDKFVVKG